MNNEEIKVSPNTGEIVIGNKRCFCVDKDILDCITNLQEENERLHKELDYADNYNIYLISRIDKSIEYIETQQVIFEGYDVVIENELSNILTILKGDSNEKE